MGVGLECDPLLLGGGEGEQGVVFVFINFGVGLSMGFFIRKNPRLTCGEVVWGLL